MIWPFRRKHDWRRIGETRWIAVKQSPSGWAEEREAEMEVCMLTGEYRFGKTVVSYDLLGMQYPHWRMKFYAPTEAVSDTVQPSHEASAS